MKPIDVAQGLDLPRRAVALVLAGGRGSRLKNLTDTRARNKAQQAIADREKKGCVYWSLRMNPAYRHSSTKR